MVNTDYKVEAITVLLQEDCTLQRFFPLIPYKDRLLEQLKTLGCKRKSDALRLADEELMRAGLQGPEMVGLFRQFLTLYDPRPQKMREIASVSGTPEEEKAFRALYLLPGVKSTRARLYMRAGYPSLERIAVSCVEELIEACVLVIAALGLKEKAPLPKEARTHIAVARAFTDEMGGHC